MSRVVKQDVLGFQVTKRILESAQRQEMRIPINDIETMKMLQSTEQLSCIETTPMLIKFSLTLKVIKQFTAID